MASQLGERIELIFATDCSELFGLSMVVGRTPAIRARGNAAFLERVRAAHRWRRLTGGCPSDPTVAVRASRRTTSVPDPSRLLCLHRRPRRYGDATRSSGVLQQSGREAVGPPFGVQWLLPQCAKAGASFLAWRSAGFELSRLAPARARDGGCSRPAAARSAATWRAVSPQQPPRMLTP